MWWDGGGAWHWWQKYLLWIELREDVTEWELQLHGRSHLRQGEREEGTKKFNTLFCELKDELKFASGKFPLLHQICPVATCILKRDGFLHKQFFNRCMWLILLFLLRRLQEQSVQAVTTGCLSLVERGILFALTRILSPPIITFSYLVNKILFKGFLWLRKFMNMMSR